MSWFSPALCPDGVAHVLFGDSLLLRSRSGALSGGNGGLSQLLLIELPLSASMFSDANN